MKLNLPILLIVLIICPLLLVAQNNSYNLYLLNTLSTRKFDQSFNYSFFPSRNWIMNFNGSSVMENRLSFDQTGKVTMLDMDLSKAGIHLSHTISSGFEYLYDASNLESELKPYKNRTGFAGYNLKYSPLDSLYLNAGMQAYYRDEQDRYADNRKFFSQGLEERIYGRWQTGSFDNYLSLNADWQNKKMDWEVFNQYSAGLNGNLDTGIIVCNASVSAGKRIENIYTLIAPNSLNSFSYYDFADRQARQYLDTNLLLALPYDDRFNASATNQYSIRALHMNQNKAKDNSDYNNQAQLTANYLLMPRVMMQFNAKHSYYIKALNLSNDSRIMESRLADTGIAWEYTKGDSLQVNYTLELRRTSYPDAGHQLDNDLLNRMLKLSWTSYWKERIKIRNRLLYLFKDEVYIDSWLSANNNTATSLQWQPECELVLGDSFLFQQMYKIRADYDDYLFNSFSEIDDDFYRQLTASYHLIYDSSPLLGRLIDSRWALLPFRNRNLNAVRLDLSYDWDRSEIGTKTGDYYTLSSRNDIQTLSFLVQKQYGIAVYQLQPRYSWGSWKELSLAMSAFFQFNQYSYGEISVNPLGETYDSLDWRVSCSVNLLY